MKNFFLIVFAFFFLFSLTAQKENSVVKKANDESIFVKDHATQSNYDITGYLDSNPKTAVLGGINSKDDFNMCGGINSTVDPTGTLYDSGGPTGNYTNGENCSFLIDPGCAISITLSFNSFHLEGCCDYFKAYDGTDQSGTLLMSANGSSLPDPVTAYSGAMFITFTSDGSVIYPGWEAVWVSTVPSGPPVADFSISDENPPFNSEVVFTDLTTNLPNSWEWDFGDGSTSNLQNPSHSFSTIGEHVVTLISDNCYSTDTVSHTLIVQDMPIISVEPSNFNVTFEACVDSTILPLTIYNTGDGALNVNILSGLTDEKETVELLALTYGVDYYQEYTHTIEAINLYFTDYNLTEINTTDPVTLQTFLEGKDVLLIAEQEYGDPWVFAGFSSVLNTFINDGGSVVFCGTSNQDCIFNTNLFDGSYYTYVGGSLTVLDETHPITTGLPPSFSAPEATYAYSFYNSDLINLVQYNTDFNIVCYREIGLGKAIYVAFDFYSYNNEAAQIIANAVAWVEPTTLTPDWFTYSPDSALILPGDSAVINCSFNSVGLESGFYSHELLVNSNDPVSPSILVPAYLTLEGSPQITPSEEVMDLGSVMTGGSFTDNLIVFNTGCKTLIIDEITTSSPIWSVNTPSMIIPPFSNDTLLVTFSPTTITDYYDTLYINSDDTLYVIHLEGVGVGAPVISINPTSFDITFADCNEITNLPLTIYNTGLSQLEFETTGGYGISYDSTSIINYYTWGALTEHFFTDLNSSPDTLTIEVTLNGDFDSSNEFASLWIEGTFIEQIVDNNVPNGYDIVSYYEYTGDILSTWLANDQLQVSIQNSSEVDVGMGGDDIHKVRLMMDGIDWLEITPENGIINVGDSAELILTLDGDNKLSGLYATEFLINSNDPVSPSITVPVELEIIGTPEIGLSSDCMDFGIVFENSTTTDSIMLYNNGCNTLIINSLTNSTSEFDAILNVYEILPRDTATLSITFNPTSVGTYVDTLSIYSNDNLIDICLAGTAEEAPEIFVNPNSFSFNLDACEGFAESQMYIGNEGGSNLNFEILGGGSGSGTIELLALTYGVDYYQEYLNTLDAINQYFTDYNLTEIYTTVPSELQNSLNGKDVLLIAEQEEGSSYVFSGFSSVLMNFVENGGSVIFCGTTNYDCLNATNLLSVSGFYNADGNYLNVLDDTHPLTEGLPNQIIGQNATLTFDINDYDAVNLIEDSYSPNYDVLTYKEIDAGVIIFVAYDYYEYNDHAAQIIAKAVEWGAHGVLPSWLTIEPGNGIVVPSDSTEIALTLNSSGMDGGIYETTLNIMSNDPLNLLYEVPITMNVSYNPCADFTFLSEGCNGFASFFDATTNNPILWQWDFGDGGTAAIQNPTHVYSSPGDYTVQLIACNATHCDTISYLVDIESTFGPVEAICYPETYNGYSYRGINNVTFNTIYNTTGGSDEGYQDYTCTDYTNVIHGMSYEISVENYDQEIVRVWIDYNSNGEFEDEEMVMDSPAQYLHTEMITIPSDCAVGDGLRMRVGSEANGYTPPGPCDDVYYGQFEDYTIIVEANTVPPVAMFDQSTIDECQGIVHFSDLSLNLPTEWLWNFGDGETSSYQNPYHTFTAAGIYTVSLTATNQYGSNTTTNNVMINSLYPDILIEGEFQVFKPMTFSTTTIGAISWLWDFGDGYSSTLQNPTYTYTLVGNYTVSLTVQNGVPCTADIYEDIYIGVSTGIENPVEDAISIYPNPAQNFFVININAETPREIGVKMYDSFGRLAASYEMDVEIEGLTKKINIDKLEKGMYSLQVFDTGTGEIIYTSKLVVH